MEEEDSNELNVARQCARCGAVRYVSLEETTDAASLCKNCRTGNVAAVPAQKRKNLFSRPESGAAAALRDSRKSRFSKAAVSKADAESPPQVVLNASGAAREVDAPEISTPDPAQQSGLFEILRASAVAPTFTAERARPNLRIIIPMLVGFLVLALGIGAFLSRERTQIPETPAGERLEWLLLALNNSSQATAPVIQETFSAWAIDEFGSREIIAEIQAWDQRHGEYRLGRIVEDERFRVVVLITTESMEWGELTLEVEPQSPNEIRRFTIGPADPPR
ncbi:MAG: hypothetical protein ACJAYU_003360 [Bradymonadia bacterium]